MVPAEAVALTEPEAVLGSRPISLLAYTLSSIVMSCSTHMLHCMQLVMDLHTALSVSMTSVKLKLVNSPVDTLAFPKVFGALRP